MERFMYGGGVMVACQSPKLIVGVRISSPVRLISFSVPSYNG